VQSLFREIDRTPGAKHVLAIAAIALALFIVGHFVLGGYMPGSGSAARWTRRGARSGNGGDPWALAQRLAADGKFTEAAHALYGALLARVAARVPLRLHPSKTAGDYARDLRRSAPPVFGPFRDFARSYEVIIYGFGACDQPHFQQLIELAGRVVPELGAA
jgi:Domain of unknown function (DUF4129)